MRVSANMDPIYSAEGFLAGSRFATPLGWRAIEQLCPGDRVMVFPKGHATLLCNCCMDLPPEQGRGASSVIAIPAGAFGNREPVTLTAGQKVLVRRRRVGRPSEEEAALVPAEMLLRFRGVKRVASPPGAVIHAPVLSRPAAVLVGFGMAVYVAAGQSAGLADMATLPGTMLSGAAARLFITESMAEDLGVALSLVRRGGSLGRAPMDER